MNLAGYLTESVEDGLLAFERIQKEKFDLILLDVMIPGMDGFKLMEKNTSLKYSGYFFNSKDVDDG